MTTAMEESWKNQMSLLHETTVKCQVVNDLIHTESEATDQIASISVDIGDCDMTIEHYPSYLTRQHSCFW